MLFYALSWTPSILPRPWYFQGVIGAVGATAGYAVGVLIGWLVALACEWGKLRVSLAPRGLTALRWIGWAYVALTGLAFPLWSLRWQRATARMVEEPPPGFFEVIGGTAVAALVIVIFGFIWRGIMRLTQWTTARLTRRINKRAAQVTAAVIVLLLCVAFIQFAIVRGTLAAASWGSNLFDSQTPEGAIQPTSPLRSGSPDSLVTWDSLAREGKWFVSRGPNAARIEEVTGKPAKEPIRAYSSLGNLSVDEVSDRVVAELDRTHAWERKAILVNTSTGRGNVNEWSTTAFEFLMGGDCAAVATQYSSMPSAFLLFSHRVAPADASESLIGKIVDRIQALPADARPKLYLSAESLGAFGSNQAFTDATHLLDSVDGALWMGTPEFTDIRGHFTKERDAGSTAMLPVVDAGRQVRFAGTPDQITHDQFGRPLGAWKQPRILYFQHASDPVVWWEPELLWRPPEWLDGDRDGPATLMRWYPFTTFWQVTIDMAVSRNVPFTHGHNYHASDVVPCWTHILDADPALQQRVIDAVTADVGP